MSLFDDLFQETKKKRKAITKSDKAKILKKQDDKCAICKKKFTARSIIHYDHKKALALGGSDTTRNLQALCPNCHAKKTRKDRSKIAKKTRKDKANSNDLFSIKVPELSSRKRGRKSKSIWEI